MKQHLFLLAIVALAFTACGPVYVVHQDPPPPGPSQQPADAEDVSYQSFYDELSPYGQWVDDPQYGYVWLPDAGPDFKPYSTNGHWVFTDEGWTWASDYPWGWAAFHYGRWFFQDGYGWMWIPGQEWAPAWVSWRNSPDYYGWAPLGPSISIEASFGGGYNPPPHYWSFVPHQYVASPQIRNYYVNETRNGTIINNTTVINNRGRNKDMGNNRGRNSYAGGPDANDVGRFSGAPLRPVVVRETRRPGEQNNNSGGLTIYRPRVNPAPQGNAGSQNNPGRPGFAPARVQPLNNARPVNRTVYSGDRNNGNNGNRGNNANNGNNNQPVTRPIAQPVNPPVNQGTAQPFGRPGNQPANTSSAQPTQPTNQGANQPANQPFTRPTAQPGAQPANQPSGRPGRTFGQPAQNPGNQQQPNRQLPNQQQPVQQPAIQQQQPAQQQRPTQQQPAQQPANQQQPALQPANQRSFNQRPGSQQVQQVPNRQPFTRQPLNQPVNPQPGFNRGGAQPAQPAQPVVRPATTPGRPAPKPADDKKKDEQKRDPRQ